MRDEIKQPNGKEHKYRKVEYSDEYSAGFRFSNGEFCYIETREDELQLVWSTELSAPDTFLKVGALMPIGFFEIDNLLKEKVETYNGLARAAHRVQQLAAENINDLKLINNEITISWWDFIDDKRAIIAQMHTYNLALLKELLRQTATLKVRLDISPILIKLEDLKPQVATSSPNE